MDSEQTDQPIHVIEDVEIVEVFPTEGPNAWGYTVTTTPVDEQPA